MKPENLRAGAFGAWLAQYLLSLHDNKQRCKTSADCRRFRP